MGVIVNINGTEIPESDLVKGDFLRTTEKLQFQQQRIIASSRDIILQRSDDYSDLVSGSLLADNDFFRWPVYMWDDDTNQYIWRGTIKTIKEDHKKNCITIQTSNNILDLAQVDCVYDNSVGGNETPAEAILNMITDTGMAGILESDIVMKGFRNAISIQESASVYVTITYTQADGKKLLDVISELCRITQCHLYSVYNYIYFYQWQPYGGEIGMEIVEGDILPRSYSHEYDDSMVVNAYSVAYDNSGTVAYETDTDTDSIDKHGRRSFNIPNQSVDSTSSSDFKILLNTQAAAEWCGSLAIQRFSDPLKYFEISVDDRLKYIKLNDLVRLNWSPFNNEPGRIFERVHDREKGRIAFTGVFLNTPQGYVTRDSSSPESIYLLYAAPRHDGSVILKFLGSSEPDHLGYRLYITTALGEWSSEDCHLGTSPVDIKLPSTDDEGNKYIYVHQLNAGTTYYFKMRSYDEDFNISEFSNVVSCVPLVDDGELNQYYTSGDGTSEPIEYDSSNPYDGTEPSGFSAYGSAYYGVDTYGPAGVYDSQLMMISQLHWRGQARPGGLLYQKRTSEDGATFTDWSDPENAVGICGIDCDETVYTQVRFVLNPLRVSDTCKIFIRRT